MATPFLQAIPVVGEVADAAAAGINMAQRANTVAKAVGYGQAPSSSLAAGMESTEPVVGAGANVKRRRTRNGPVALRTRVAPLHTSERNAVVRKVMTEHNLSMIAASKYVKEHGLWKSTETYNKNN